jgi:hypothetical protein
LAPCSCCICWGNEYNQTVFLSDDIPGNTQNTDRILVTTIPITGNRFSDKYHIEIQQLSLTSDTYNFWKLVKLQQRSGGNIFQPNSVKVRGNITSQGNPNKEILGVFFVVGIASKALFIYPSDVPAPIPDKETILNDCRLGLPNGSTEQPDYW